METILFILLGMFIGWNLPQPSWAMFIQNRLLDYVRRLVSKK